METEQLNEVIRLIFQTANMLPWCLFCGGFGVQTNNKETQPCPNGLAKGHGRPMPREWIR